MRTSNSIRHQYCMNTEWSFSDKSAASLCCNGVVESSGGVMGVI